MLKGNIILKAILKDCCQDRYKNTCFILKAQNQNELEKTCTTGKYGEPYLINDKVIGTRIVVDFTTKENIGTVEITFSSFGQVAELIIE